MLWFGVIESGITTNYLLLPVSFMLIAIAVDVYAVLIAPMRRRAAVSARPTRCRRGVIALAARSLTINGVAPIRRWRASMPRGRPFDVRSIDEIRDGLQPTDRVVCTDELGCLMLVGRIDRWLALDDFVRERFLVRRGDAPVSGVYTGVPAVFRPGDLFAPNADGTLPDRILDRRHLQGLSDRQLAVVAAEGDRGRRFAGDAAARNAADARAADLAPGTAARLR